MRAVRMLHEAFKLFIKERDSIDGDAIAEATAYCEAILQHLWKGQAPPPVEDNVRGGDAVDPPSLESIEPALSAPYDYAHEWCRGNILARSDK